MRRALDHELQVIGELGYAPFFLTVYDIVRFARTRPEPILCQGRGSAANSIICYCLGITDVSPDTVDLLFERFVSAERREPPDIDVDFEHERREEVIQHIYAKYGRERAGLAATVICYRGRSAIREVGKVFGLSADTVALLASSLWGWSSSGVSEGEARRLGLDPSDPRLRLVMGMAEQLIGAPRHLSQHVGGFVIAAGRLDELAPIQNAAMQDRTVVEWDKDDLDELGLLKVDVLALGMLTAIRLALAMVNQRRGTALEMADILAREGTGEGKPVYEMLCRADSVGVFQVESRAQMSMLPRLKPRSYYDLVIEVAIVRPGPIQGGMVHPYLANRQRNPDEIQYPPRLRSVLERTLGVPIFQEQVMEIAMVAAGFSAGKADRLRRAMAAWKRSGGLEPFKDDFVNGMLKNRYDGKFALQVFEQIRGFGEYGFPESHSASFALLVYVSAWLKCYEPAAFTCALLNSQPMGFYQPAQLVQDARRHGVEVRPVQVLESQWLSTLEETDAGQPALRLGLHLVKGFPEGAAQRLIRARSEHLQPEGSVSPAAGVLSFEALALRAGLSRKQRNALAAAGALESLAGHRHEAAWLAAGIEERPAVLADAPIFEGRAGLPAPTEGQDILADYATTGLTLRRHPMALLRARLDQLSLRTAEQLQGIATGSPVRVAGIVTCRQHPGTAKGVIFVTLEDETGQINVVVWKRLSVRQRRPLLASRLLRVDGILERSGETTHLIAENLEDYSALIGGLDARSRDFH